MVSVRVSRITNASARVHLMIMPRVLVGFRSLLGEIKCVSRLAISLYLCPHRNRSVGFFLLLYESLPKSCPLNFTRTAFVRYLYVFYFIVAHTNYDDTSEVTRNRQSLVVYGVIVTNFTLTGLNGAMYVGSTLIVDPVEAGFDG